MCYEKAIKRQIREPRGEGRGAQVGSEKRPSRPLCVPNLQTPALPSAQPIPGTKELLGLELTPAGPAGKNAPSPSLGMSGGGGLFRGLSCPRLKAGTGTRSLRWRGAEFSTVSSLAGFATLLIEDVHVQFKKPSVSQTGGGEENPLTAEGKSGASVASCGRAPRLGTAH